MAVFENVIDFPLAEADNALTTDVMLAFESFVALLRFIPDVFILPAIVKFVKAEQL